MTKSDYRITNAVQAIRCVQYSYENSDSTVCRHVIIIYLCRLQPDIAFVIIPNLLQKRLSLDTEIALMY
jgi:hypothetical protein